LEIDEEAEKRRDREAEKQMKEDGIMENRMPAWGLPVGATERDGR